LPLSAGGCLEMGFLRPRTRPHTKRLEPRYAVECVLSPRLDGGGRGSPPEWSRSAAVCSVSAVGALGIAAGRDRAYAAFSARLHTNDTRGTGATTHPVCGVRASAYGRLMTYEAASAPDLRRLAGRFSDALQAVGFDFERPSLAAALRGYEEWLRKPVRGLEWGKSDCAIVAMEPTLGGRGSYEIGLRRHVGDFGDDSSVELNLVYAVAQAPGFRGLWGTTVEALDEAPAIWIAGELRNEPAITAALADDRPVAAELRINGSRIT
jgi:hypothetical protein